MNNELRVNGGGNGAAMLELFLQKLVSRAWMARKISSAPMWHPISLICLSSHPRWHLCSLLLAAKLSIPSSVHATTWLRVNYNLRFTFFHVLFPCDCYFLLFAVSLLFSLSPVLLHGLSSAVPICSWLVTLVCFRCLCGVSYWHLHCSCGSPSWWVKINRLSNKKTQGQPLFWPVEISFCSYLMENIIVGRYDWGKMELRRCWDWALFLTMNRKALMPWRRNCDLQYRRGLILSTHSMPE